MPVNRGLSFFIIVLLLLVSHTSRADSGDELLQQGTAFARQGQHPQALKLWREAIQAFRTAGNPGGQARVWYRSGMLHFQDGHYSRALHAFQQARDLLAAHPNKPLQSALKAAMGSLYLYTGDLQQAEPLLKEALGLSQQLGLAGQAAAIQNDLGSLAMQRGRYRQALEHYQTALSFKPANEPQQLLHDRLIGHALIAAQLSGQAKQVMTLRQQLQHTLKHLPNTAWRPQRLLQAGRTYAWLATQTGNSRQTDAVYATQLLHKAAEQAAANKQTDLQARALIEQAYLYYRAGRLKDALHLNQQALFLAQSSQIRSLLVRGQWLAGRIYRQQNKPDKAINAYQQAIDLMPNDLHRTAPSPQPGSMFAADNIYIEYAELLLSKSAHAKRPAEKRKLLYAVRDSIESLKAVELQDYFQDSCVTASRSKIRKLDDSLLADTAVLYPIVFADRIELLLSHSQGIERFTTEVTKAAVIQQVRQFRIKLEKRRTRDYRPHAETLYNWLIRPLAPRLAALKIQTLITIPDLVLRGVPIAALYDGKQFLIEQMAVATSPGLELTDTRVSTDTPRIILAGLTKSVQGYPALLYVQEELNAIQQQYGGNMLLDEHFQSSAMKAALGRQHYQVAHIASHGEFARRVEDSFLLTYDSRVRVNELASAIGIGRFASQPLELLTLSACYTAAGDDRAALGLAGITVKAGARSALASLWPINDRATAKLMGAFYHHWQQAHTGKAAALRLAQLEMLSDVRYRHPGYWSPFLLIGNWR